MMLGKGAWVPYFRVVGEIGFIMKRCVEKIKVVIC